MDRPRMRIASVVLGAPNPRTLATFYQRLLGGTIVADYPARPGFPPEDGWAMLRPADQAGLRGLAIQWEPDYVAPVWPPAPGGPQMMLLLASAAGALEPAAAGAVGAGAPLAAAQPQQHVRVLLDPAGHPFC